MADNTPKLGLPFMSTAQVQKELTFNELAAMVDTLVGLKVETIGDNDPPGAPDEGDAYIVGTAPTGVWVGKAKNIAFYIGGWHFIAPDAGWLAWNVFDSTYYRYNVGTTLWTAIAAIPIENLVELLDVAIAAPGAPEDGQAVVWDNASGKFVLQAVAINLADLGDVDLTGLADGHILSWDAVAGNWVVGPQPAASAFTDLTDTPAAYTGLAGFYVAINATEDGLEFIPPGEGGGGGAVNFTDLGDVPPSYSGAAGLFARVTDTEDGIDFVDINTFTAGVPAGGLTNQVLRKTSDDDFEVEWVDPADVGTDFPDFTGNAKKKLRVAAGEVATEWVEDIYSVPFGFATTPGDSEVMLLHVFAEPVDFADDFAGSQEYVGVLPTADYTFTVARIVAGVPTDIGTIVITTLGVVTFTTTGVGVESFAVGEVMRVTGQASADATLANCAFTLKGNKA